MAQESSFKITDALAPSNVDRVNYLNIFLMIVSVFVAARIPFEMFLFAYAVLGPLHYLTEISWLHDRRYFSTTGNPWLLLLLPVVPLVGGYIVPIPYQGEIFVVLMVTSVLAAGGMVFCENPRTRLAIVLVGFVLATLFVSWRPFYVLFAIALPTLVHVYVFTGLFIVYGALKARSTSGYLSAFVFLLCPIVCLFVLGTPASYEPSVQAQMAMQRFNGIYDATSRLVGLSDDNSGIYAFMRLMAFAYTYHYLNWFSKTRIINWHQISRRRLRTIIVLYIAAVTLYAIDFDAGFIALGVLSMGHVVLEFPLNYRSAVGIVGEIKTRFGSNARRMEPAK